MIFFKKKKRLLQPTNKNSVTWVYLYCKKNKKNIILFQIHILLLKSFQLDLLVFKQFSVAFLLSKSAVQTDEWHILSIAAQKGGLP